MVSLEELEKFEEILKNGKITPETVGALRELRKVKTQRKGQIHKDKRRDSAEVRKRAEEILENFIDSYIINVLNEEREDIVNDVIGEKGTEVRTLFHTRVVNELEFTGRGIFSTQNCVDSIKRLQKRAEKEPEISEILKYYEAALYMNERYTVKIWTYMRFIEKDPDVDYASLGENQFWWGSSGEINDSENLEILEQAVKDKKIPKKIKERLAGLIEVRKLGREKLEAIETKLATSVAAKLAELIEKEPDITEKDAFDKLFRVEGIDEDNIRELIRLAVKNLTKQGERDSDLCRSLVKLYGKVSTRRLV
ncbi:TPA: hypothetical protein H1011_00700 [archaeon]|jgi:hypothetical protein|uniref:Uncharacterized protein n=1 Tax=Candidatus Undinarchaeum marinum TaxID=2756141 RepID=A0A832V063_9ARCH|nr:hypothetical protein [Candidatus Undinarchaeum marinum]